MNEIRIYVEGGGDGADTKAAIRRGFGELFSALRQSARDRGIGWHVIACGSRQAAFRNFKTALATHLNAFNLLLIDAESRVERDPWQHLRAHDGWEPPLQDDRRCHLMAQVVEAWLVADGETLARYYGQGFLTNALPRHRDVEAVEKQRVLDSLDRATRGTQKGKYRKIAHCSDLLARIDPDRVQARAGHCSRLFRTLASLIDEATPSG